MNPFKEQNDGKSSMPDAIDDSSSEQNASTVNKGDSHEETISGEDSSLHHDDMTQNLNEEDIIKLAKSRTRKINPNRFVVDFLLESFNDTTIRTFCYSYFEKIHRQLKEIDRFEPIIVQILTYCEQCGEMDYLWECIKKERPNKFVDSYEKWKNAVRSVTESNQVENNLYTFTSHPTTTFSKNQNSTAKSHPLASKDNEKIKDWFFNNLTQQEQSLVVTVALFEGISRNEISKIAQEIEQSFFNSTQF